MMAGMPRWGGRLGPRRWLWCGVGVALLGNLLSAGPPLSSRAAASSASPPPVLVQVSLWNASAVLQAPCEALLSLRGAAGALDRTSPLVGVIPRYSTTITVQTLAGCRRAGGGVEALQSFLRYTFPLSTVHHDVLPAGSSFPPLVGAEVATHGNNPSNSSSIVYRVPLATPLESKVSRPPCNGIRGRLGTWVRNATYANETWYVPGNGAHNAWMRNQELTDGPYDHSSYVWEADHPACPVERLTLPGFCREMAALNVTRMLVLGDSIEFMRLVSFVHLLGLVSNVHAHLAGRSHMKGYMRHSMALDCSTAGVDWAVQVVFYRTNHLMPLLGNETYERRWHYHKQSHELVVCYGLLPNGGQPPDEETGWCPWVKEYINSPERTLVVSGVGAHFHDMYYFQESMQRFFGLLREYKRPDDIVWLRTVLVGHERCDNEQSPVAPLASFRQYRESYSTYSNDTGRERWYGWELYERFNQYMEAEAIKIQRDTSWGSATVELLDIYWMTALRRDGHPSKTDCLHYLLPGPPDWWNHLFYSNLKEIANP